MTPSKNTAEHLARTANQQAAAHFARHDPLRAALAELLQPVAADDAAILEKVKEMSKTVKVSTTLKKHYAKSEASRYALCWAAVYPRNLGDQKHTTGICNTCEKLVEKEPARLNHTNPTP